MAHTDIAVIHLSNFHHIKALNLAAEIRNSLKAEKTTKVISLNTIVANMGTTTNKSPALFYAFSGSDSTSLKFKGKRSHSMLIHSPMCNYCQHSTPNIVKVETWKNWQQTLSIGCTQTNLTITSFNADLVRMSLFSQTTYRDVREFH